ncbi:hypothetical protein OVA26_01100 [Microbacterium sp. SL62]|uniref:hypothetical protein n=1 Tax=Microbacterium sp. SL62 TaxID=2995139 RepID=UPI0022735437|nr:hypothetical protein [Microbacterium sp. SL62]MCY1715538.1 hypothetical protein [Microbacterium sp. SL62]
MKVAGGVATCAVIAIVASGCGSGAGTPSASSLTITFTDGSGSQSVVFQPDRVECDDSGARGISLKNDPQGRFSFVTSSDGATRGSVGAGASVGLVAFQSDDVDVTISDGLVRVGQSSGEVAVVAGWTPDDGFDVSEDDAAKYAATLSGELRCD